MKNNEIHTIYETDNIEQVKLVSTNSKNTKTIYNNTSEKISPILTLKINEKTYTKWNPKYIEYLKKKNPDISDNEIASCINEAIEDILSQKKDMSKGTRKR